jgi:hypothetical protein
MAFCAALLQASPAEVASSAGSYYGTFWFALALINAAIAQLHKRSGLNWFLLSIVLGPIATLILVAQYKRS